MSKEKRKVAVLYDVWEDTPSRRRSPRRLRPPKGGRKPPRRKKKKEKLDREEIFDALAKLGHEPSTRSSTGGTRRSPRSRAATRTSSSTSPSPTPATTRRT